MRLLAGRVVAVDAMLDGAEFVDVYRGLADDHGLSRKAAFDIATRVFRSGGFAKDLDLSQGLSGCDRTWSRRALRSIRSGSARSRATMSTRSKS